MKPILIAILLVITPGLLGAQVVDFATQVRPIFEQRCTSCHGDKRQQGDLRLDTFTQELFAGEHPVVTRGKPDKSSLIERIRLPKGDPDIMPAKGDPLSTDQIDLLHRWVEQGAPWPSDGEAGKSKEDTENERNFAPGPLSTAQLQAREVAQKRIVELGGLALPVAADTLALDVNLSLLGSSFTDALADLLKPLASTTVRLNLARTSITDGSLAAVGTLHHLEFLNLSQTSTSDAGIRQLAGLEELRVLNLHSTGITDACVDDLLKLKKLQKLYVWGTGITRVGEKRLKEAAPALKIDLGREAVVYRPPPPVNTTCPVMADKPVDPNFISAFKGEMVAFCCGACQKRFESDPSAFAARLDLIKVKPINTQCPMSGDPIVPGHYLLWNGAALGFCSGECKKAFEEKRTQATKAEPK